MYMHALEWWAKSCSQFFYTGCHVHIYHHNVSIHAIFGMEREMLPPKMKNKIILVSQEKKKELGFVRNLIFDILEPIQNYIFGCS